jgi:peptidoglycan/LPS O-acetylase OafA/YrhL
MMSNVSAAWNNPRLKGRIPELDGLRGLAILLVLIYHYFILRFPVHPGTWQAYAMVPFLLTWSGVDLFFVLSGFLIGGILYDAKYSDNYYKTFYLRRTHRIFPVYFIWIALFVVGLNVVGPHSSYLAHILFNRLIPTWSYPLFLQNFFMSLQRGFGAEWMGPTWSLTVEEQFYLLLPLLVRQLSYRGLTRFALASVVAAPIIRLALWSSGSGYVATYTLLPCRADALALGVLIAIVCRNKSAWEWLASRRSGLYAAFAVLTCGVVYLTARRAALWTFGLTWIAVFYASLLLLVIVNPGKVEIRIFRSSVLRKLGTVAYATYLSHEGINYLFHLTILKSRPLVNTWPALGVTLLALGTTLSLSAVSWHLMEKRLIRRASSRYHYTTAGEHRLAAPASAG